MVKLSFKYPSIRSKVNVRIYYAEIIKLLETPLSELTLRSLIEPLVLPELRDAPRLSDLLSLVEPLECDVKINASSDLICFRVYIMNVKHYIIIARKIKSLSFKPLFHPEVSDDNLVAIFTSINKHSKFWKRRDVAILLKL